MIPHEGLDIDTFASAHPQDERLAGLIVVQLHTQTLWPSFFSAFLSASTSAAELASSTRYCFPFLSALAACRPQSFMLFVFCASIPTSNLIGSGRGLSTAGAVMGFISRSKGRTGIGPRGIR